MILKKNGLIEKIKKIDINEIIKLNEIINNNYKCKARPSNCLKFKKNTKNINLRVSKTSNDRMTLLPKCAICNSKKSRFIKKQEVNRLLSSAGLKTP